MAKELSGVVWVSRFPDAKTTSELAGTFRSGCQAFIAAMEAGGAHVEVSSTRRPKERAHLMHYAWRIHRREKAPNRSAPLVHDGQVKQWPIAGGTARSSAARE